MMRIQILVHRWGPEQRFRRCFADGLNQSFVRGAGYAISRTRISRFTERNVVTPDKLLLIVTSNVEE